MFVTARKILLPSLLLPMVLLAGCAGMQAKPAAQSAAERAEARWELLLAGNATAAYDFFSPGYRQMVSRENYAAQYLQRPVRHKGAKVISSECPVGELYCDIGVSLDVELPRGLLPGVSKADLTSPVRERWIQLDGVWYFAPKEISRASQGLR